VEAKITGLLMEYFAQHPRAMDTAEGVVEWWIPAERIRTDAEAVHRILERLTEQGVLERIGSGEYAHYRLKSG
jgi:predicted transcriptional regulator of viral defense system